MAYLVVVIALSLCSSWYVIANLDVYSGIHVRSRLGTIWSLVHKQSFTMDESCFRSIDSFEFDGHIYSSKPIVYPFFGAIVYGAFHTITGMDMCYSTQERHRAVWVINFFLGYIPHMVLLLYFFFLLQQFLRSYFVKTVTFAGVALGYVGVIYATGNNRHSVGAMLLTAIFFHFVRIWKGGERAIDWLVIGLLLGLLPVIDPPSLVFSVLFLCLLVWANYKKALLFFLPLAVIPILLHCVLMWSAFGMITPATYVLAHKVETVTQMTDRIWRYIHKGMERNLLYAFHMTFGNQGIFIATPLLLPGLYQATRSAMALSWKFREMCARILMIGSIIPFLFYLFYTHDYSGVALVIRWLIPMMPMFILFAGVWLEKHFSPIPLIIFLTLLFIGHYHLYQYDTAWEYPKWRDSSWVQYCEGKIRAFGEFWDG